MLRLLCLGAPLLSACAPRLQPSDTAAPQLDALAGEWSGTLTYTDYGDDQSRTTLPITATASSVQDPSFDETGLLLNVSFREPDGTPAGSSRTLFTPLSDAIGYDLERWQLITASVEDDAFSYTFETESEDNNRPATIRQTVAYRAGVLTNRKEVRYEGTNRFFERNIVELTRTEP